MSEGSRHEDAGRRPLIHFFDPQNDRGLWVGLTNCPTNPVGSAAYWWGLNDITNEYSLIRARESYDRALTALTPAQRELAAASLFYELGPRRPPRSGYGAASAHAQ